MPSGSVPTRRFDRSVWVALGCLGLLAAGASLTAIPRAGAQETPYTVTLTGVEDGDLRTLLESAATLFRLAEEPPPSPIGLNRRAEADRERLQAALRSAGYYDGTVEIGVNAAAEPAEVTIRVEPGPAYRFDDVSLVTPAGAPVPGELIDPAALGLEKGARARAPAVVDAEGRLIAQLAERGHAYARVVDRRVVVDHGDRTMDIAYTVEPGPQVRFGELRVEGLEAVEADVVRGRMPWKPGDAYVPADIEKARDAINNLGVFGSVRVRLADLPEAERGQAVVQAPVIVELAERKFRYIGASVNFSTDEGFGGSAYWGHRNLFGGAEQLRVAAEFSGLAAKDTLNRTDFQITGQFRKPDFLMLDQALVLDAALIAEQPTGYTRNAAVFTARLEQTLVEGLTTSYGVTLEESRITDNTGTTTQALVGAPLALTYDATNNLLDPTQGYRAGVGVTPYMQIGGADSPFLITRAEGSTYYDFAGDGRYVGAARLTLGSILDGDTRNIPADKRFYAGGGGSIRGYAYQKVGPLDVEGDPTGGRSLFEVSAEMRIKVTDTVGLVPFIDGGNVYESTLPDIGDELRWGAGLGVRYYTDFGPLRLDVGVPLNRREGDAAWQLYISLGQAF